MIPYDTIEARSHCGLDHGRHGTLGAFQSPIRTVGVDLVAREFRLSQFTGNKNRAPAPVHLFGVPVGLLQGENKDFLEHFDNVVVSVIVIVQQNYPIKGDQLFPFQDFRFRSDRGLRHSLPPVSAISRQNGYGMHAPVYLDHQATTPVDPRVLDAMLPWFTTKFGNAASRSHRFGWEAETAVDQARTRIAALAGATAREIVFTSGATESNNLAIKGIGARHIVTMATEHKSVLDPVWRLGIPVTVLTPRPDGLVDLDQLNEAILPETGLVSIMFANNEIGTIQPVREIGSICRAKGVPFHCDAAQAFGKIPIDAEGDGIDLLSVSAHKMYGPKGVGALYVRRRKVRLTAQMDGGGHEAGMRSGTLNVPGIVGFGEACAIAAAEMDEETKRLCSLRDRLLDALRAGVDGLQVNGTMEHRLPGNLNVSFSGTASEALLMSLPEIALSAGSACSSASVEPSHVLRAIGVSPDLARGSVRFGLGRFNTEEEIDYTASRVVAAVTRLRALAPA